MKTDLGALNNYLFEELERLNDDECLEGENLDRELKRAKAIATISMGIVSNANVVLKAKKYAETTGEKVNEVLMLND